MNETETYIFDYSDTTADDHGPERRVNFIDCAQQAADTLTQLLDSHTPLGTIWQCSRVRWVLDLEDVIIEVFNQNSGFQVLASSDVLSRKRLDTLRNELRSTLSSSLSEEKWGAYSFAVLLLRFAEMAVIHLEDFRCFVASQQPKSTLHDSLGWDTSKIADWTQLLSNEHGVDLLSVSDTAKFVLGRSITDIIASIPGFDTHYRLIHVEPVFRSDLVTRFLRRRYQMQSELESLSLQQLRQCVASHTTRSIRNNAEALIDHLTTPHVTYHGAPKSVLASIVRYGLLVPGSRIGKTKQDRDELEVRCGSSFGKGIYSSPSFNYASIYSELLPGTYDVRAPRDIPGFRILVCATLMGRSLQVSRANARGGLAKEGAHSHVSPDGMEYIVFDSDQILPCYILNVDYGMVHLEQQRQWLRDEAKLAQQQEKAKNVSEDILSPGEVVERKDALRSAARKWFPYGFGPMKGSNFVIEAIADVDDDEEEFGEFQSMRQERKSEWEGASEDLVGKWRDEEKTSWFDEYQGVRGSWRRVGREDGEED